jgi:hypothetical protein
MRVDGPALHAPEHPGCTDGRRFRRVAAAVPRRAPYHAGPASPALVAGRYFSDRQVHSLPSADSSHSSDLTLRKGNPSLLGAESGFPAITEPPPDHEPLSRAARSGENLIEENRKSEVVTKAASTHANWWGYYRQKD